MLKLLSVYTGLSVDNIANAKNFYTEIMGLTLLSEHMGLHLELPGGGQTFVYEKPEHQAASFTVLNFVVSDIDDAIDNLTRLGVTFERYDTLPSPQDKKGILRGLAAQQGPDIAWFKDPAGNILSIIQDQ